MLPRKLFSEEHELYRDQVRRFIEREITPRLRRGTTRQFSIVN